jgi:hypothetical protein
LEQSDLQDWAELKLVAFLNGNDLGAVEPLASWLEGRGWRVLVQTDRVVGIGESRNIVMRQATEASDGGEAYVPDYVMELHSDMVFPGFWAEPILDELRDDQGLAILGTAVLSGRQAWAGHPVLDGVCLGEGNTAQSLFKVGPAAKAAKSAYASLRPRIRRGLSCPCIKRWSALCDSRVGGPYYPAEFGFQEWEDTDEARRLENAGYRFGICLDSWVYHHYVFSRMDTADERRDASRKAFFAKYPDGEAWVEEFLKDMNRVHVP